MIFAWASPSSGLANETGVVALQTNGEIVAAGWTVGFTDTADWIDSHGVVNTLVFVDAPLVVTNEARSNELCEKHTGQHYWPGEGRQRTQPT